MLSLRGSETKSAVLLISVKRVILPAWWYVLMIFGKHYRSFIEIDLC